MKTLKQILEECDTLEIRENDFNRFLIDLVRMGLLEESKLALAERALTIDAEIMTEAEKNTLAEVLRNVSEYMLYEAADDEKKIKTTKSDSKYEK